MEFKDAVHYRRSVRYYLDEKIDTEIVKSCIELATLAPNSSNMQLWEFYHVTNTEILKKLAAACLGQSTAYTAPQMVVFVTRQDLHWKRASKMKELSKANILKNSPREKQEARLKKQLAYYAKVMPFLYARFFGLIGLIRKLIVHSVGLFKPMPRQVSENDTRVVVHKTCGLAAQTFMLAMADQGYDTCPMEGFDSIRVKRILNLPFGAEVNMIISCGLRAENGVFGDRVRVPFEDVYKTIF